MKNFHFATFSDTVFYSIAVGLVSLCVMRYYGVPLAVSITVSLLLLVACALLVFVWLSGRHGKKELSKKELEEREKLMLHLALDQPERVRSLLLCAFSADGKDARLSTDALVVDGTAVLPIFTMQPLSADSVAVALKNHGGEKFTLACNALSPEAGTLLKSFAIEVMAADEIYRLLVRTDSYPKTLICGSVPRRTVKTRLCSFIKKSNARPFFVSGLLLLIMSLFTFFPVYYLTVGCILTVLSLVIRLFGRASA